MLIDKISYANSLKDVNPLEKFILSAGVLVFLLMTKEKTVFIMNFVIFNFIILFIMKVSAGKLLKLYSIPAVFILTTLIPMFLIKGDITVLLLRAFASLSAAYFLMCSTPAADLDYIFEKLRFPKIFREMFLLIYRYIFVLFDIKDQIITAQKSRSGYVNYRTSKRSFGILLISILRKTYYYSRNSVKAVEARLGNEFIFYQRRYNKPGKEAVFITAVLLINLFLVVWYA